MNTFNPAIIVVAYNRPRSLKRLLFSLLQAKTIENTRLIISIDNQEPDNYNVKDIADNFQWPFGEKEVIYHAQRLGLRKHILLCGDLSEKYGSVIILEDDLFVSPHFYDYAVKALEFYQDDDSIAGISLYNQPYEETNRQPFNPIDDNTNVYFVQFPSSLGQAWSADHWKQFKVWYNNNPELEDIHVPKKVSNWPETSWKKYFCLFLVSTGRYFVYPRVSLTTNFNDPGTHLKQLINHDGQVQLQLFAADYQFLHLKDSDCVYDSYFELLPRCINKLTGQFQDYSFEMDLYGHKSLVKTSASYIITSRPVSKFIAGFKRALKPHELNVIFNLEGNELFLCKKEDVLKITNRYAKRIADYKYFYNKNLLSIRVVLYNFFKRHFNI